ncbi:glutathionylspermidine synthase family protein [Micrococcus sp. EYE_162]|uniref:glutathionylspermidine synthase family protein n=1 Tax=Micrococcus TaxID=1269 RepID=UPI00200633D8|nr:glutathionylspermidine synthase family protein [Micrococcus sp. EYE_212]MCK6171885.1 glutathionylspermidine synthase family protein [Micrococcus sp. EYE_162]
MQRISTEPRPDWEEKVASQGLVFSPTLMPDGSVLQYWNESAAYVLTMDEVMLLEQASERLHAMSMEAARFLASEQTIAGSPWRALGLPREAVVLAVESLERGDPHLYGRFDLVYSGPDAPPKMLEYNADTPTGLIEAAVAQWFWKQDVFGEDVDQWNGIFEALVDRWREIYAPELAAGESPRVHFAHTELDETGEDAMTVACLRDAAEQAGLTCESLLMSQIGFDTEQLRFTGADLRYLTGIFKLYPWEDMAHERFGPRLALDEHVRWIEPAWKMLLSTKALSAALWHLFPGDDLLLPTYLNEVRGLTEYVRKPLHGREGAGIRIVSSDVTTSSDPGRWGEEGHVFQQYHRLPDFPGPDGRPNRPVLGTWMVGDECFGVGIRESDGPITDPYCRFVPNIIRG